MTEDTENRIFDKLEAISTNMATMSTSVAVLASQQPAIQSRADDHEKRLRAIEARLWSAVGILAFLAFAVPLAVNAWL